RARGSDARTIRMSRVGQAGNLFLLAILPAGLVVYFAFNGGGFFPGTVGLAAAVLALMLVVHTTSAERPFAGASWGLGVVAAMLAAHAGWTLASRGWSHAP